MKLYSKNNFKNIFDSFILLQTLAWAARLSKFQLALTVVWLARICTCWCTAVLFTGISISTVTLFTFFHYLVSTYRLIRFDKASWFFRSLVIDVLLDAFFTAWGKQVIVGFDTRCGFIKHDVVSFRIAWCTSLCIWIMLDKDKKWIIKTLQSTLIVKQKSNTISNHLDQ